MTLAEMLAHQPPVKRIAGARSEIRRLLLNSGKRIVVIDDDPTGTQTVHDVRVYLDWGVEQLRGALSTGDPAFYISTNSRGLTPDRAKAISLEVGRNLREAAASTGRDVVIASRSDSTLRGHFPYEVEALTTGLGLRPDGIVLVPAFFEGGRYTINDVHYVEQDGEMAPAHATEFANDPTFGFKNSNLKAWVEEKTKGAVKAETVRSISLRTIREGGPDAVAREFLKATGGEPVVINAACYEDLDVMVLGLLQAESQGKAFAYRCAASFVKVRGGFEDKALLSSDELVSDVGPGLVVVGSYVGKTSRQLDSLLDARMAVGIELCVDCLLDESDREDEIARVRDEASALLAGGSTVAVYTSRATHLTQRSGFLDIGKVIMDSLCRAIREIDASPRFVVAKGGITSIEIARVALGIEEGYVLGQILPGVPVWRTEAGTRWPGIPYVVFPGNVGDEQALRRAVGILQHRTEEMG